MVQAALESAARIAAKKAPKAHREEITRELEAAARRAGRASKDEPFLPRDRATALIQAAMDQRLRAAPAAPGLALASIEIPFSNADPGWATVLGGLLGKWFTKDAKFVEHKNLTDFQFAMPDSTSVALFADWGTGEQPARDVAAQITARNVDYMIHLGDIYYAGLEDEAQDRFLDRLPASANLRRRFALNGNHEMYSGGHGYFERVLPAPTFGQPASYFSLANTHWRIIGLDTAYKDQNIRDPQMAWLEALLADTTRKNILLTHHQGFSCFEGVKDRIIKKIGPHMDAGRIHAWFWGHEHLNIVYREHRNTLCRCIGHGAIPYLPPPKELAQPEFKVQFVNRRKRAGSPQGVNGCAILSLNGAAARVEYVDEDGFVPFREDL